MPSLFTDKEMETQRANDLPKALKLGGGSGRCQSQSPSELAEAVMQGTCSNGQRHDHPWLACPNAFLYDTFSSLSRWGTRVGDF